MQKILKNGVWTEIPLSANKLNTARKISLNTAAVGTATAFDGSKDIAIPVTSVKEAYLAWGGRNISGDITPVDAAMSNIHNANRFAFASPAGIKVEYSRDGGTTWVDYPTTDTEKIKLVSGIGISYNIGGHSSGITTQDKLRITLNAVTMRVYTSLKKLLINVSSNGASGCKVFIERAYRDTEETFRPLVIAKTNIPLYDPQNVNASTYPVSGWSGWNSIPIICPFGGYAGQKSNTAVLRLTFSITALSSTHSSALSVSDIMGCGTTYWVFPSRMAKTGHLYDYDVAQNAIFPAQVKATSFIENGTALSNKYASLNAVSKLIGNDTNKSVRTIASEEVAKIVANAPTAFDTLKEISDWIGTHSDDAMRMDLAITQNANNISGLTTRVSSLESNYGTLDGDVSDLQQEMSLVQQSIGTINENIGTINESVSAHTTDISNIKDGTTRVGDSALLLGYSAQYFLDYNNFINKPTIPSLDGYLKKTDAKIENGVITINGNSITPLTQHQSLSNYVTLNTAQDISGLKTFLAPANVNGSETTTMKLKTSNGGSIRFGKEGSNSGTMIRLDQVDGTCRLRFRASATAGAMVWEQPEHGANLFIDLGNRGGDYHRISMPRSTGTLALTSQIPSVYNPTITVNQNGEKVTSFTLNQSGSATINLTDTTYTAVDSSTNGLMLATDKVKLDGIIIDSSAETWSGETSQYIPTKGAVAGWVDTKYALKSAIPTKVSQLTNDSGYLTSVSWANVGSKPTTLSGYGITDCKINNNVITIGNKNLDIDGNFDTLNETTASHLVTKSAVASYVNNNFASKSVATQSANGLMSSTDKTHLDSIWNLWGSEADADALVNKISEVLAAFENFNEGNTIAELLAGKQAKGNYVSYTNYSNVNVVGNTKDVAKISPASIFVAKGLIMGGTAQQAGLVTRGICGVSTPNSTNGASTKDNLYINFDGDSTYRSNRQLVLQAGSIGTDYGHNLYAFCAARGDAVKAYCDANYGTISTVNTHSQNISALQGYFTEGKANKAIQDKNGNDIAEYYAPVASIPTTADDVGALPLSKLRNINSAGSLQWTSADKTNNVVPTINTIAYWNGAYSNTASNLEYVKRGRLGGACTRDVVTSLADDPTSANLATAKAVVDYVKDKIPTSMAWSSITSKPTTISGYGITDCEIVVNDADNGDKTVTIGNNTFNISSNYHTTDISAILTSRAVYQLVDDYLSTSIPTIPTVNDTRVTIYQNSVSQGSFTLNQSGDEVKIYLSNTTYSLASSTRNGLMSKEDKSKLEGIIIDSSAETWSGETSQYIPTKGAVAGWVDTKYALKSAIPTKVSQLENDAGYLTIDTLPNNSGGGSSNQTTTVVFGTSEFSIVSAPKAGTITEDKITLTDSVRAGDKVRVYFYGGPSYESYGAGIVEFKIFSPASNKIAGSNSAMLTYGAQHFIAGASVNERSEITTTTVFITVYALDESQYGNASQVYVQKVERIR